MPKSTFFNLPEEKQKNIIEIAFQEFSDNVYEKASIRNIIAKANISTGAFYRYFDSKDELYLFLIEYKFSESEKERISKNVVADGSKKFWRNFKKSSSDIRKKYYFRVKNNLLYDMRLDTVKDLDKKNKINEKDTTAIAFLVAVLPYIMQELCDLTDDEYYDDDKDSAAWMMLRDIIYSGINAEQIQ